MLFRSKYAENVPQRYAQAAEEMGIADGFTDEEKAERFLADLHQWKSRLGMDRLHLRDYGFVSDQADEMVKMIHWVGGGPLTRDRYRFTDDDLAEIIIRTLES